MKERRRRGAALVSELELPDHKTKGWEFTDLAELDLDSYSPPNGGGAGVEDIAPLIAAQGDRPPTLTQVDGGSRRFDDAPPSPDGPIVVPLDYAVGSYPDLVEPHLGSLVSPDGDPFVARNDANWTGGAFVYVPKGHRLEEPIELIAAQAQGGSALNWRLLVVLEEDAEAEIWEQYVSQGSDDALFNGVVELIVGDNATLRFVSAQGLSDHCWVFASQRAELGRQSSLEWVALGFGSAQGKVRMETRLGGEGSSAKVTGVYAGGGRQHIDYDTTQEHAAPHTTSDLAFRGVLTDRSTSVWRGMIRVDPGAQQTDAFQESRNLLLTPKAHADAIPGLEIEADDVRCTHAAAIAQVDRDQLYYLRARGLSDTAATRLIIDGFMQTLVERASEGPIRQALSGALEWRLEQILDGAGAAATAEAA